MSKAKRQKMDVSSFVTPPTTDMMDSTIVLHLKDGTKTKPITIGIGGHTDFSHELNLKYSDVNRIEFGKYSFVNMPTMEIEGRIHAIPLSSSTTGLSSNAFSLSSNAMALRGNTIETMGLSSNYMVTLATCLPQNDDHPEQQNDELKKKRKLYELKFEKNRLPMLKSVPWDAQFTAWANIKFVVEIGKIELRFLWIPKKDRWETIPELKRIYKGLFSTFLPPPQSFERYRTDTDFGRQRLAGTNNIWIRRCKKIPDKLDVTGDMMKPFLDGETFEDAIKADRIFFIDYSILDGCAVGRKYETCAPIALFYHRRDEELIPIAIQLNHSSGKDNPVFLPSDHEYTWIIAKMWFNNADAAIHEAITHLGYTHLVMEGISAITNRHLSVRHPLYQLLAPHFLFIHAINAKAITTLLKPGGVIDKNMNIGVNGILELVNNYHGIWRMNVEGTLPEDLKNRGVGNANVLRGYYFRDDALLLYNAIKKYVDEYLKIYYTSASSIADDNELQDWRKEMVHDLKVKGVPGTDKGFRTRDEISLALTCIIYTCSVGHAAANFKQYDEYCFPPNYPLLLHGDPPKSKDVLREENLLKIIASKRSTREVMEMTRILSTRSTDALGDFEVNYISDARALKVLEKFRTDLKSIDATIEDRNKTRHPPYRYLDPTEVPNAISI